MFRLSIIFLYLGLVSGCSSVPQISQQEASPIATKQTNFSLKGNLIVRGSWNLSEGSPCEIVNVDNALKGRDPSLNAAIQRDLKVTVKNSKGEVVALGNLGEARTIKDKEARYSNCAFPITVDSVPISDFYTISVGNIEQTLAKKDVEQNEMRIYTEHDVLVKLVPQ
ncbi:MAG: hypothetical protein ACK456_10705 [Pseudanabaenaceae cyanobacterium]|jgi:hypothetical protein